MFKVVKVCNNWAVGKGKIYYPDTLTANKEEAQERATIQSLHYYYDKARAEYDKLLKKYPDKYDHEGNGNKTSFGDIIC